MKYNDYKEFLIEKLLNVDFEVVGNNTLIYNRRNNVDFICVTITMSNIIIVHDGWSVVHNITMIPILPCGDQDGWDSMYLQPILQKF